LKGVPFADPAASDPWSAAVKVLLLSLGGLSLFVLIAPLLVLAPLSVTDTSVLAYPIHGVSSRWYVEVLSTPRWILPFRNSVIVAFGTTILATSLGICAAVGMLLCTQQMRRPLLLVFLSPLIAPVVVLGVALSYAFGVVGIPDGLVALIAGHTLLALPFTLVCIYSVAGSIDKNVPMSAMINGATPIQTLFRVVLPLLKPGIFPGALFAFVVSFDEVVLALFLSGVDGRTLPRQIFSGVRENISPAIVAASVVMIALTCLIFAMARRLRRDRLLEAAIE
jgi:putative spermidine/putrescine transport system permease protein